MIGKIIGGIAGAKLAEKTSNIGGTGGALLGATAVAVVRRLSLPALLAVGAGGYAYKKFSERKTKSPAASAKVDSGVAPSAI